MKIVRNTGAERVIDLVRPWLSSGSRLDVVSSSLSLFAFAELRDALGKLAGTRLLLPADGSDLALLGGEADRSARNRLETAGVILFSRCQCRPEVVR